MKHQMEFFGANTFINDKISCFRKKIDANIDILAKYLVNQSGNALNETKRFKNALYWSTIFAKVKLISGLIASTSKHFILNVTSIQFDVPKDFELQQDLEASESMEIELQSSNELADIESTVDKFRGQLNHAQELLREIKSFDHLNFDFQETIQELEHGISVLIDVYGRFDSYLIIEKLKVHLSYIGSTDFEGFDQFYFRASDNPFSYISVRNK